MDQWNRIESPEINPHTYSQLIINKGGKNIKWERDNLFSNWYWESWIAACKSVKLEHTLTPCTEINSKWLQDLNIRQDTIKLLEDNIGKNISDINSTNILLGQSHKAIKKKQKQMGPNKTYKFLHRKGNYKQNKKTTCKMRENSCKWCTQQELNLQNIKTTHTTPQQKNNPVKKWAEDLSRNFSMKT